MKKLKKVLTAISEGADLPGYIAAHLPYLTATGFGEVSVDLQQGLVSYADTEIVVRVSLGLVSIRGYDLRISLMREGRITVKGRICDVHFSEESAS